MTNENTAIPEICKETELLIDEHLDGMISLKDKEKMDLHVAGCTSCSSYLEENASLIKNLHLLQTSDTDLSYQQKNEFWNKIESRIDKNIYPEKKKDNPSLTYTGNQSRNNFFYRYRYIFSGLAAVLVIAFIVYGVKNMKTGVDRMAEQNQFGIADYWKVSSIQGNPMIGNVAMSGNDSIKEGQWIQTNSVSKAELIVADIGKIIIEPNSKVVFVKNSDGNNRILVEYGTINADMKSNSKSFFVEMPSAVANDNGSSFTMTVDSTGDGLVFVKSGKVDVQSKDKEVIIPAGSLVLTKKDIGVGTPFNENSSEKFKSALFSFDFGNCGGNCVTSLLDNAKMSDAVTLVNLIPNIGKEYTDEVYVKLANFVRPPAEIHGDSIGFIDDEKLNQWIDKIQVEVQTNVEQSLKDVEKSLENIKEIEKINPEVQKNLENFAKNWKFQIKTSDKGEYVWEEDSLVFDKEQFKKDMEEMKQNIKEYNEINKEELKENMEQLKEDLKDMKEDLKENLNLNNEQLKKELEKANEEIRKAMKEVEKLNVPDSLKKKIKVNVNTKDGFEYNYESGEDKIDAPDSKLSPEKPEGEQK